MPRSRRAGRIRRQDVSTLLSPEVLTAIATDFTIMPVYDTEQHDCVVELMYFDRDGKLAMIREECSDLIEAERRRLASEGWPPADVTSARPSSWGIWPTGNSSHTRLKRFLRLYATSRHATQPYPSSEWTTYRLHDIEQAIRQELTRRWS